MYCQAARVCFIEFLWMAFRAMSFLLRNAFMVSHKFWYGVPSFSLNSKKSLISFFISSMTKFSLSRALFSFHMYVHSLFFFYWNLYSKNGHLAKSNLQIQCNLHQNFNSILHRVRTNNLLIHLEY